MKNTHAKVSIIFELATSFERKSDCFNIFSQQIVIDFIHFRDRL